MNLCGTCGLDFGSVSAFDTHRVGKYQYDCAEGLERTPPREDGRRCLDEDEMLAAGLELDGRGRWRLPISESERERLRSLRAAA